MVITFMKDAQKTAVEIANQSPLYKEYTVKSKKLSNFCYKRVLSAGLMRHLLS